MNADGLWQIPLTARNAELASVPGQSDIYIYMRFSKSYTSLCIT